MRLDKYLKVSRLMKRRTVANEACDAGRVLVNSRPARASLEIRPGDEIEIRIGVRAVRVRVLGVDPYAAKGDAAGLYQILSEGPAGR